MVEPASIFVMGSFVAACSAKVARLPQAGESLLASHFVLEPGGKGLNLAIGTSRLGVTVDGLLAIGNDFFAGLAADALHRASLPQEMLLRFDGATGAGIGFIDAAGENCLAVYPGANARLSPVEVHQAATRITGAKLLLAQFEIGDAPIECAYRLARQADAATLLNPSPYRPIPPEILANTSILVLNRVEASCLAAQYGLEPDITQSLPQLAPRLFATGVQTLIVTLGSQGAWLCEPHAALHQIPAFPAEVIDTLGAGDAFIAAFAAAYVAGLPLPECVRQGAAAGACATEHPGVFNALPTRAQLEKRLAQASK